MSNTLPHSFYYELFKFFQEEHGLILLDSEIQDIIHQVNKFQNEQNQIAADIS